MNIGLVFMCTDVPNEKWLERINALDSYQYTKLVVTDLEDTPLSEELMRKFSSIQFYQVKREEVLQEGYWDFVFADRKNKMNVAKQHICTWDKALYLHQKHKWNFNYVWFFEYDVMIPKRDTISFLDYTFPDADLLCSTHISYENDPRFPWWSQTMVPKPWFHSMVCACRVSSKLLRLVHEFAKTNQKLFYLEIMLNTLAAHANLKIVNPVQMKNVVFMKRFQDTEVNAYELIHPVKDFQQQERIWKRFED